MPAERSGILGGQFTGNSGGSLLKSNFRMQSQNGFKYGGDSAVVGGDELSTAYRTAWKPKNAKTIYRW
jgi:hypothetical protein